MGAILDLFVAASMPVLKVLLVTGLGSILALERFDLLGEEARKHLNNVCFMLITSYNSIATVTAQSLTCGVLFCWEQIVFFVFNPSLVSSNLANSITYESMMRM